jgi:hypothetical protein
VKECILHIYLSNAPDSSDDNRKNNVNSSYLDHRTKGVFIVDVIPLFEDFCNQPGLIPINGAIRFVFDLENPFAIYQILHLMHRHKMPGLILHECRVFNIHGSLPIFIS